MVIKVTFNPLQLIKLILWIGLFSIMGYLDVQVFLLWGSGQEVNTRITIVEKNGSGSSREFIAMNDEGQTTSIHPEQSWFDGAEVDDTYYCNLAPARFDNWLYARQILGMLSLIVSVIWLLVVVISWIAENIHKLDRDVDIYVGENTFKSPIQIKRVVIHELQER